MNIIKQGDPNKIEEYNRKHELKTFRCPICGCVWKASIKPGTTEARITTIADQRDDYQAWVSDCPMANCKGVGREYTELEKCKDCKYFNGWTTPNKCDFYNFHITNPHLLNACDTFKKKEEFSNGC